ncbi:MAG TPA: PAS domain-containing protein, partial [Gallionella sp.]|nr:PAS domain-containing protein [Gallionella sp.]
MPSKFWLRLLRNYLPVALLLCALGIAFYASESAEDIDGIIRSEHTHLRNAALAADRDLLSLARDTQYLANTLPLTKAIDSRHATALEAEAASEFVTYLGAKQIYSKLRWIDETGREQIHIDRSRNGVTTIAPERDEQDKSRRYYFAETMKKQKGETYLSPLDLEIENGSIELPLHPVLRAATPVFDHAGQRRGLVIVTYDAQELFRDIGNIFESEIGNWMLFDQDGYWLRSPDKADEFGFMLPHRANMAARSPSVWARINAAPQGHFTDESGDLWVFTDIAPYRAIASSAPQDSTPPAMSWKMVKHISTDALAARSKSLRDKTLALVAVLLALSLLVVLRLTRSQLGKERDEAKLRQAASELGQQKFALDQHAIVAITDVNGTITYVNDKFCTITQYPREELLGQNHRMLNSGKHDPEFFQKMLHTIASGEVWHSEVCNRAKDGSLYWVNSTFVPLQDESGKPRAFIAISTDVTQTKLHEQRLEEAQRLGKIGHWELDLTSGRLNWSSETFSIFEIDPQRFSASYEAFLKLVHPEDRELVQQGYNDSVANGTAYDIQHRLLFADGRIKWVSERGVTHYAPDGKALLSVGTVQDITAQKEAEEKLRIASIAF